MSDELRAALELSADDLTGMLKDSVPARVWRKPRRARNVQAVITNLTINGVPVPLGTNE